MRAATRSSRTAAVAVLVVLLVGLAGPPAGPAQARAEGPGGPEPGSIPMGPIAPEVGVPGAVEVAEAPEAVLTVCLDGPPSCDYATIQEAVDAAGEGDTIKVATGVYIGVQARPAPPGYNGPSVITQVVYISKSLTLRGGYTTTNGFADPPDAEGNPTTLDAQGQGRVLFIGGDITATVKGLRLKGGDAEGLGAGPGQGDAGGGVYVLTAMVNISGCVVFSNTANFGGGLFLEQANQAGLTNSDIFSNTARYEDGVPGWGGGLFLNDGAATIQGTVISGNTANRGGGLCTYASTVTLRANRITANTARSVYYDVGIGGGVYLFESTATLEENVVLGNTASGPSSSGGGIALWQLQPDNVAVLTGNLISANTAELFGGGMLIHLNHGDVTLRQNVIHGNSGGLYAGGLALRNGATLIGNAFISNTAESGGGLVLYGSESDATLVNNLVVDNQASGGGSGLQILGASPRVLHSTIANNAGGDGSGIYVTDDNGVYGTASLSNTILAGHEVGITVTAGNTVTLEATLWGNVTDWGGAGTIVTGTVNLWGDPAFVDPDAGDYHIGPGSAAIDAGVATTVTVDIDGEPRPMGDGVDIGADELRVTLNIYLPLVTKTY